MTQYSGLISDMTAAQQSGNKGVELWLVDATGQIWTTFQNSPGGSWSSWDAPFAGQDVPAWKVTAADQNTGCLMFFMLDESGYVWAVPQLSPGGSWGEWTGPGLADQPVQFVEIAAAQQSGNRGVSLKAIDTDGMIWVLYQTTPGGAWSNWEGPGFYGQPEPMVGLTQAGQNNGDLELFTINAEGSVWAIPQLSPGGNYGSWAGPDLAGQPVPYFQISAAQQSGNRGVSLKTIASDGQMWVLYQTTPGGAWSKWEGPGFKNQPVPMRLLTQAGQNNGDLEVFTIDTNGNLWTIKQLSPGGDWGAWSQMSMPPADETSGWDEIGTGYSSIVGAGGMLYAVDSLTNPWLYSGFSGEWTQIGGPGYQFVGTSDGFYGISPNKDGVYSYDINSNTWTSIGGAMSELIPAWTALHGMDSSGNVWMYSGVPGIWNEIGGPFKDVSANDDFCFGITTDGQSVQMTPTGTHDWVTIGGPMESLIAAGDNIYGIDKSGNLYCYSGTPMQWTEIGSGFAQVVAWGVDLFALSADKTMVQYYQPDLERWQPVAGPTGAICAGNAWIAGLQNGTVSVNQLGDPDWNNNTDSLSLVNTGSADRDNLGGFFSTTNWMISIYVAADSDSFNGRVGIGLNDSPVQSQTETYFRSGEVFTSAIYSTETHIDSIKVGVKNHNLSDKLRVTSITCLNQTNGNFYTFEINGEIPNKTAGESYLHLTPTTSKVTEVPSAGTLVYIWRSTDFWNGYVGHASMQLTDGTYISWWPDVESEDAKTLYLAPTVYSAPHLVGRTYADDYDAEERTPEVVVDLGTLDEAAIRAWWDPYDANENSLWEMLSANCSSIVYQAMLRGGVMNNLSGGQRDYWDTFMGPWTPDSLASLMTMFKSGTVASSPELAASQR